MTTRIRNPEVRAMRDAYLAITSQPDEAWGRMLQWLNARIEADMRERDRRAVEGVLQETGRARQDTDNGR